jgi:hypothetical protein
MKNTRRTLLCLSGAVALCASTQANTPDSSSNPYQSIVDRNVFGLRPPPPPPSNEPVRPPPPPIALTGITTILGKKLAFLNVQVPGKPGEQGKGPQSYMLGVGEREGDIEVLDIDEKGGIVKVNDFGVVTNVPFAKVPSTPTAPVATAGIPSPGGVPNSGVNPLGQRIAGLPARPMRGSPNALTTGNAATPGSTASPGLTGYSTAATTPQANREIPMTAEEQIIMMEAQREHLKSKGDATAGLLPPTELTSQEDVNSLVRGGRLGRTFPQQVPQQNPQLPQ